ncbi:transcription elongation factor GreA [Candidatus Shapirobacteria bacterium CG09_land_8_20_14_0_10_39_12]|uniref:Transcription elongation factor GreA n=1 Tax=Candidatus Shapirobacteria bacterium CG09_land_8_20_14_0_10_39_12 TaxID=1974885 RepID=A0A2H0WSC4_9BACT|nr:MAG: transcription elongation factor GreA [Candidatus Shapirobacteria bacterium CG09_land_8_20_14_0_10_39_12]
MKKVDDKVYLTKEGFEKLEKELNVLKSLKRPDVVERLSLARLQGDLSENNEYASAKEELTFIDGRIEELDEVMQKVCLVDEKDKPVDYVGLGCRVTVKVKEAEAVYHIVGEWEADPSQKKVSDSSPLGQALLGKKVGEEVCFEAPVGKILFKIIKID